MTFDQLAVIFKPGMTASRKTWDTRFSLQQLEGDVIRLRDRFVPSFGPPWRSCGYDRDADDYQVAEHTG